MLLAPALWVRMNKIVQLQGNVAKIKTPETGRVRLLIAGDLHFPFHDPFSLDLLCLLTEKASPNIMIINGDLVDFHGAPTRFYKPPERRTGFKYEIYADRQLIKILDRKLNKPVIFLQGNHERRLEIALAQRQIELHGLDVLSIPKLLDLPKRWRYVARRELPAAVDHFIAPQVQVEGEVNLFIQHGDLIRISGNTQHIAKCIFTRVLTNMIISHWHRNDLWIQSDYKGKAHGCWVNGCLCLPRPDWDAGRVWGQGVTIVDIFKKGLFEISQVKFMQDNGELTALFGGSRLSVMREENPERLKNGPPPLEEIWNGAHFDKSKGAYTFSMW